MAALNWLAAPLLAMDMLNPVARAHQNIDQPVASPAIDRWRPFVAEASLRFGIPQDWIIAVMRAESGGETHRNGRLIVSRAGAMGLMQLMPATWAAMRAEHGLGHDPHDPRDNILAGTAYLRAMYDRFGYPGLFAAYNAGPARYAGHLRSGRSLPAETRDYIRQLAGTKDTGSVPTRSVAASPLFFSLGRGPDRASPLARNTARASVRTSIFAPLTDVSEE
mgnify:FL=1